ncbi:MAG: HEPN domain-containing protein [Chloroflexi bacterium]|nr:HEPN domain-containing protein [Chloroflexota bacterium]
MGYLREAEEEFSEKHWWTTVANAQLAIENAAKAVIALFEPVEKVHDPSRQLQRILDRNPVPESITKRMVVVIGFFPQHGHAEHIKATYGEDKTHTAPWELFVKKDARIALTDSRKSVRNAQAVFKYFSASAKKRRGRR